MIWVDRCRRWLALLAAATASLILSIAAADGNSLFYASMTESAQRVFDVLYDGLQAKQGRIDLPAGTSYEETDMALAAIRRECAELCLPREGFSIVWSQRSPDQAEAVTIRADWDTVEADRHRFLEIFESIEVSGSQAEKAVQLAGWLADRLAYTPNLSAENYTCQHALSTGEAQCASYAGLYAALCRMHGIPAAVVEGNIPSGPHAWNLICVDGNWQQVDLTAMDAGVVLPPEAYQPDDVFRKMMEDTIHGDE